MTFDSIIFEFAQQGILDYNEKTAKVYKYYKILNSMLARVEGEVFLPSHWSKDGSVPYYLLSEENRKKVIVAEYLPKRDLGWKRILYELKTLFFIKRRKKVQCVLNVYSHQSRLYRLNCFRGYVLRAKVICLKEELDKSDLDFRDLKTMGLTYQDVFADSKQFDEAISIEDKEYYCKATFSDFIFIRDFVNAEKWYDKLTKWLRDENERKLYENYWNKIQKYLEILKDKIKDRNHIVVNWIDALKYEEVEQMTYLSKEKDKGIFFDRMYTSTPYTSATMRTLITGKRLIDDNVFKKKITEYDRKSQKKKAGLLKVLADSGYEFRYVGADFVGDLFTSSCPCEYGYRYMIPEKNGAPSTIYQSLALEELANSTTDYCLIIHNLVETHMPFLNPVFAVKWAYKTQVDEIKLWDLEDEVKSNFVKAGRDYIDEQLKYYSEMYASVRYRIYMSDHGKFLKKEDYSIENLYHVLFIIAGKGIEKKEVKQVFSLMEFSNIVNKLLNNEQDFEVADTQKIARIQMDDGYNLSINVLKNSNNLFRYFQSRGIVTSNDSYLKFKYGRRYYEVDGKEVKIQDDNKERIHYLDKLAGDKFIDINKKKKYRNARKNYLELEKEGYFRKYVNT